MYVSTMNAMNIPGSSATNPFFESLNSQTDAASSVDAASTWLPPRKVVPEVVERFRADLRPRQKPRRADYKREGCEQAFRNRFWSILKISARLRRMLLMAVSPEVIAKMTTANTVTIPSKCRGSVAKRK